MQEKKIVLGDCQIYFWLTDNIQNCINNVELTKNGQVINIKEIVIEYMGKQPDDLYTLAEEQNGLLRVSTFRGLEFLIDADTLTVVKKQCCK